MHKKIFAFFIVSFFYVFERNFTQGVGCGFLLFLDRNKNACLCQAENLHSVLIKFEVMPRCFYHRKLAEQGELYKAWQWMLATLNITECMCIQNYQQLPLLTSHQCWFDMDSYVRYGLDKELEYLTPLVWRFGGL